MKTETAICAWCHPGTTGNHTICPHHRAQLLAEYRGEVSAAEVAGTYRELERAAELDEQRQDRIMIAAYGRTGWTMAREVAIGMLAGALILGTAFLAMLAL
jgi:hypothetical protein